MRITHSLIAEQRNKFAESDDFNGIYRKLDNDPRSFENRETGEKVRAVLKHFPKDKRSEPTRIVEVLPKYRVKQINWTPLKEVIYDHVTGFQRLVVEEDGSKHFFNALGDYDTGVLHIKNGRMNINKHELIRFLNAKETYFGIPNETIELLQQQRYKFQVFLGSIFKEYVEQNVMPIQTGSWYTYYDKSIFKK